MPGGRQLNVASIQLGLSARMIDSKGAVGTSLFNIDLNTRQGFEYKKTMVFNYFNSLGYPSCRKRIAELSSSSQ